jgi:DNA-binding NarL/FixJ family response regulator
MTTKTLLACLDDLFFQSKIEATARHLNVPVRFTKPEDLVKECREGSCAAVLVDLSVNGDLFAAVRQLRADGATRGLPIVGFLSHVDRDLARRAEEAGVTQVMPRSQFSESLPDLMMDLLAPGTKREIQEEPELPDE